MSNILEFTKRKATKEDIDVNPLSLSYLKNCEYITVQYHVVISLRNYFLKTQVDNNLAMFLSCLLAESFKRLEHTVEIPSRMYSIYEVNILQPSLNRFGIEL